MKTIHAAENLEMKFNIANHIVKEKSKNLTVSVNMTTGKMQFFVSCKTSNDWTRESFSSFVDAANVYNGISI